MRGKPIRIGKHFWPIVFVLPMVVLFLLFTVYPLLSSARYTLYDWEGIGIPTDFVGLKHYAAIARDPLFWNAFAHSFLYTGVVVPVQFLVALVLAVVLTGRKLKAKGFFRTIFFSPVVTSQAIVGIVVTLLVIGAGGAISDTLQTMALIERPVDWLGNPRTAMGIVIAVGIWLGLGYPLIYFMAGLQSINQDLYDAARVDGAGAGQLFRHITVPSIRPLIAVVLLLMTLHSLRVFDTVQVMTRGGPYFATDVVGTYIYRYAFVPSTAGDVESNLGFASAAAFFMGILVMLISVIQAMAARRFTTQKSGR
jgi:ABC-type sugar transport system permease subunit